MRFLGDSGKYMTSFKVNACFSLLSSVIVDCMVPIPDATEMPDTPIIPIYGAGRISINRLSSEHMVGSAVISSKLGRFIYEGV